MLHLLLILTMVRHSWDFLAYKVALLTVVYEEVRKMLLSSDDVTLESKEEDPCEDNIKGIVIPSEDGYDR
jgi:hypothetical protein